MASMLVEKSDAQAQHYLENFPNLASILLGANILFATDEWFAAAENVISDEAPVWDEHKFTPFGKWMDGWESRRKRTEGHDWCIIELGLPGTISVIEIDTLYFSGNFSPKASVYGANLGASAEHRETIKKLKDIRNETKEQRPEFQRMGLHATEEEWRLVNTLHSDSWEPLVALAPMGAGYEGTSKKLFVVKAAGVVTHLRLNMGPDGGIARIRVHGEVSHSAHDHVSSGKEVDLAAVEFGGLALAWSNQHYGHPRNLIAPGRGHKMSDGWETARQPERPAVYEKGADGLMVLPGCDWAMMQLGFTGLISSLEIDTHYYKGNYPESCIVEACAMPPDDVKDMDHAALHTLAGESSTGGKSGVNNAATGRWTVILPRTRLTPDSVHKFSDLALNTRVGPAFNLIKLTIFPDGGVMRLRVIGRKAPDSKL